eukprot:360733-Hanusia_phi.AAC.1
MIPGTSFETRLISTRFFGTLEWLAVVPYHPNKEPCRAHCPRKSSHDHEQVGDETSMKKVGHAR